jgi:hypothetical protein
MDISLRSEGPWVAENRQWLGSAHGTEATRTITLDVSAFTEGTHYPDGYIPSGTLLARITATGLYGPYAGTAAEVQTVTITGTPTGGTYTLTFDGSTTAAIAYNATAAAVQSALEALPNVTPGDVTAAGGPHPGTAVTVTFSGEWTGDVPVMTASGASLTGGSSPAVAVTTTTAGGSAGTGGLEVAAGHLFNSTPINGTADLGAPLMEHGVVRIAYLPANSGYDAAAREALRGQIIYR